MGRYRMELSWAVDAQIDSLRDVLKKDIDTSQRPLVIRTTISSAPMDESLFDSLTLYVQIDEDSTSHLRGTITEFHLPEDISYRYEIISFPTFEELKEWFFSTGGKVDFCTEILCKSPNLKI
jgi:hypothetical protein